MKIYRVAGWGADIRSFFGNIFSNAWQKILGNNSANFLETGFNALDSMAAQAPPDAQQWLTSLVARLRPLAGNPTALKQALQQAIGEAQTAQQNTQASQQNPQQANQIPPTTQTPQAAPEAPAGDQALSPAAASSQYFNLKESRKIVAANPRSRSRGYEMLNPEQAARNKQQATENADVSAAIPQVANAAAEEGLKAAIGWNSAIATVVQQKVVGGISVATVMLLAIELLSIMLNGMGGVEQVLRMLIKQNISASQNQTKIYRISGWDFEGTPDEELERIDDAHGLNERENNEKKRKKLVNIRNRQEMKRQPKPLKTKKPRT